MLFKLFSIAPGKNTGISFTFDLFELKGDFFILMVGFMIGTVVGAAISYYIFMMLPTTKALFAPVTAPVERQNEDGASFDNKKSDFE